MAETILVIGGGAAGYMAARTAAELGAKVTLIEKNERIGRKVMISGKGRCNLTNYRPDIQEFIQHVPGNGRFLYSALSKFGPLDTMDHFERLGVPLKVERGNRVFPVSDKAVDIVDAMDRDLRHHGVRRIHDRARHIFTEDTYVTGVECLHSGAFSGDAVILATGGKSYPRTGSTGDGYQLAGEVGHTVTRLTPSLVPMVSPDPCCKEMQGLSLRNVSVQFYQEESGKELYSDFGDLLFTHFGVSGPVALSASSYIRNLDHPVVMSIDLKPALDIPKLDRRIQRDFQTNLNREFQNSLGKLLPRKMIPVIVRRSGIPPEKKINQITKEERSALIHCIKEFTVELTGFRPISEAIVTSGGISTKEIDPHTMESRLVNGLFFAGEVMDVDAYTGGYNLQIAFSTGHLAGEQAVYR